jgi:hypothetical protein
MGQTGEARGAISFPGVEDSAVTVPVTPSLQRPVLLAASSASRPTAKVDQKLPECPWAEDLLTYNTHGGASPRSRQKARNLPALALLKRMLHEDSRIAGGGDSVANEQESLYFVESPTTLSLGTPAEPAPSMPPRMATPSLDGPRERRAPCLSSAISRDRAAFRSGIAAPSSPRPPLA